MKCRHKPFSVYLEWLSGDVGREVIFVEGANQGNMIAHDGGWKARIPAFSLSPDCKLAMRDSRYPVTSAGLLGLIETMLGVHEDDLRRGNVASCELESGRMFEGRPAFMFTTKYKSRAQSNQYRKSITLIDQEWNIPCHTRHFQWADTMEIVDDNALDDATLIESYSFTNIQFEYRMTDRDFDRANPEYHFR